MILIRLKINSFTTIKDLGEVEDYVDSHVNLGNIMKIKPILAHKHYNHN